jgi:hypothetical protein
MLKKAVIFLLLAATHKNHAMEITNQNNLYPTTKQFTYFSLLPPEICDLILKYLIVKESDEELIERTKIKKVIPKRYHVFIERAFDTVNDLSGLIYAYSVDRSIIVFYDNFWNLYNTIRPKTIPFDRKTETVIKNSQLSELVRNFGKNCEGRLTNIAFFPEDWILAEVNRRWDCAKFKYINVLIVRNIQSSIRKFAIPDSYINFSSLDFNKQGTKLILHGLNHDFNQKKDVTDWLIIPIAPEVKIERLGDYFEKRVICKKI